MLTYSIGQATTRIRQPLLESAWSCFQSADADLCEQTVERGDERPGAVAKRPAPAQAGTRRPALCDLRLRPVSRPGRGGRSEKSRLGGRSRLPRLTRNARSYLAMLTGRCRDGDFYWPLYWDVGRIARVAVGRGGQMPEGRRGWARDGRWGEEGPVASAWRLLRRESGVPSKYSMDARPGQVGSRRADEATAGDGVTAGDGATAAD